MTRRTLKLWFVLVLFAFPLLGPAKPLQFDHIEVELVSEVTSVQPGTPFWVALRLQPEEHWHIYWRNPGDSGLPPRIDWNLPQGSSTSDIHWPYPESFLYQDVVSYGYGTETLLLVQLEPPPDWTSGEPFTVTANAFWLVCEDTCIPGNADLTLALAVSNSPPTFDPRWHLAFETARARLPVTKADWQAAFTMHEKQLYLQLRTPTPAFAKATEVTFFPQAEEVIDYSAPQEVTWQPFQLDLRQPQSSAFETVPEKLGGVLVVKTASGESAYSLNATPTLVAQPRVFEPGGQLQPAAEAGSLPYIVLSAIIGGLLLNLMPCVFPVLSLKAISLLEAANLSHHQQRLHGIAYTLGAMVFFATVAGVLVLLRAGGVSVGWGFQLQSPWFVALLAYLLFVMGLSFSGVIELGTNLMGVGQNLTSRSGYSGSFFTGALAAVVASPCTAPFMGTAIAFAIGQPPLISLMVFLTLGFGMAFPFLLISFLPAVARLLPKPGPWMVMLRQFMAFPLYVTTIWLLWVLGRQTDASGMAAALGGMLLLAFAIWLLKLRTHTEGKWKRFAEGLTLAATLGAFAILHLPLLNEPAFQTEIEATRHQATWEPYRADRLAEARAAEKPVFLNMTADWCISCIANERVALSFPSVREAFLERDVVLLKGDWTSRNPEITNVLHQFGREGVPLYVFYPAQAGAEPIVLPQFLTPQIILDVLDKATADGAIEQKLAKRDPLRPSSP